MISIVLPVYNEEAVLPTLYERLEKCAKGWQEKWRTDYEVILVNDGSHDRSAEMLKELHKKNPAWKVVNFSRNFGHILLEMQLSFSENTTQETKAR